METTKQEGLCADCKYCIPASLCRPKWCLLSGKIEGRVDVCSSYKKLQKGGLLGSNEARFQGQKQSGEMVRQMNEREKEIFMKFYPGATTEDWLNLRRSLNEEIDELMKNLNTKDYE